MTQTESVVFVGSLKEKFIAEGKNLSPDGVKTMNKSKPETAKRPGSDHLPDDDTWVERLRDETTRDDAIKELTDLLIRGLTKAVSQRYGNAASPEDIAQDSILKILNSMDDFRGDCHFTSWALTIAIRVGVSELRRKRYQDVSLDSLTRDGLRIEPAALHDSVERRLDREIIDMKLCELIESCLTDRQQTAMRALLEGMPIEVIAQHTNSNRNAVYKLIHDARARLRDGFEQIGLTANEVTSVLTHA